MTSASIHWDLREITRPNMFHCVRSFDFEARAKGDGRTLEGFAATYNTRARIRDLQGDFDEVILPGAFTRSIASRTPVMQWDHGKDPRVGTVPIAKIEHLDPDHAKGLFVRARLFDNPVVEPVRQAIAEGAVKGMSFRFGVPEGGHTWTRQDSGVELREIRDADVHELGPVVFPAYDTTSVSVRSLLAQLDPDEYRAMLRELAAQLAEEMAPQETPPTDFVGQPGARSSGGDEPGARSGNDRTPRMHLRQRLDEGALRARGILK
jgi:HK97 family phage prohead protease